MEPQRIFLKSDLPISLRPYRTSILEEKEINKQVHELLQAGLIRESSSPYSAPVTLAYKRDEGTKTRLCIDFRKINSIVKDDAEPLPRIDSILDKLNEAKYYSTLDLASGYWHIPVHPADREKLAFSTTNGLYEWNVLPFGIKLGPSRFSRAIRRILTKNKVTFACHYFDDIIIFSSSLEEHQKHLAEIFEICRVENLKLKYSKCSLIKEKINFLGYEIENGKITPANANIETIKKLKIPKNVKELQRFLGSINVYHKFISKYAEIRKPLNKLLKKNAPWEWSEECQESYQKLKESLISKPILRIFNPHLPLHAYVDASQNAVGAVLKQPDENNVLHPIAFYSRSLRPYEQNYTITEMECLAIVDTLDKFYHYFHGKKFTIHTDHAALVWLKNIKNLRGRLFRWSLKLSMFEYEIKYEKGTSNIEADMLSRNPTSHFLKHSLHLLDANEIIEQQKMDNVCGKSYIMENNILIKKRKGFKRIVVPISLRKKVLQLAHEQFGHPGIQKMLKIIAPIYYWPDMTKDLTQYVKCCDVCQKNKKPRQRKFGLLQAMPTTCQPFEYISVDTVGGFNYYNSTKKNLHVVIDHATRYVWAFPSKSSTTETYVNCLNQVFNVQIPQHVLTDRNAAFTASRFKKFLRNNKIKQLLTSAHRPQTNGISERGQQSLVTRLKCKVNTASSKTPWTTLLKEVVEEYNNTPHTVTKFPPAYLMFGKLPYASPINQSQYPPVVDALKQAKKNSEIYHNRNKKYYDRKFRECTFNVNDLVIYEEFNYPNTRKLAPTFSGPYKILKKLSEVNYEINRPNALAKTKTEVVHSTKLRPYYDPTKFKLAHENNQN